MSFIKILKQRWQVHSLWQVLAILCVFACTGFSVIAIKHLLHISNQSPGWHRILFYIAVLPVYNIMLLGYGFIFGQFRFFLNFEKRFFARIAGLFKKKKQ